MKSTHVFTAQTTCLFFTKLLIEPDFPCLADEIAEQCPDMNIEVAAFTVSEKSSNSRVKALPKSAYSSDAIWKNGYGIIYNTASTRGRANHTVSGHHLPDSETPYEWRFAGGRMVVHFHMFFKKKIKHTLSCYGQFLE